MHGAPGICERDRVKWHWRSLALLGTLLAGSASAVAFPVIPVPEPHRLPSGNTGPTHGPSVSPSISFQLPKYRLSESERELIASCLVLEAACQGERGMRGVMAVIRNRSRHLPELYATTVLRRKQFSALNRLTAGRESVTRVVQRARRDRMWNTALRIVDEAGHENWTDPTYGATHYTLSGERTPWTRALARTVTIGRHAFYR